MTLDILNLDLAVAETVVPSSRSISAREAFTYEKIGRHGDIRLIKLKAGADDEDLECSIITTTLCDGQKYEALSYVWGDPKDTRMLICANQRLEITKNLYYALWQLRKDGHSLYLWVDAICINQGDISERNQQVQLMGTIYSKALNVLVWLGEASADDCQAFEAMEWLVEGCELYPDLNKLQFTQRAASMNNEIAKKMSHLARMLTRPWFERIWVIQEISSASPVLFICGDKKMPLGRFFNAFGLFYDCGLYVLISSDMLEAFNLATNHLKTMAACRKWVENGSIDFFATICRARSFKSTDARDKLYALLGMMGESDSFRITPDYNIAWVDTFKEAAVTDIVVRKQLRFLSCTSYKTPPGDDHGLPSWCPDWSLNVVQTPFVAWATHFQAAANSDVDAQLHFDRNVLTVRGKLLGSIKCASTVQLRDQQPEENEDISHRRKAWHRTVRQMENTSNWLMGCYSVAFGRHCKLSEIHQRPDYGQRVRILTCNIHPNGQKPSEETLNEFESFCRNLPRLKRLMIKNYNAFGPEETDQRELSFMLKWSPMSDRLLPDLLSMTAINRKFCMTKDGKLGYVPLRAKPRDAICMLYGGKVLYVLRPDGDDHYRLIGEAFLHGYMHGEAIEDKAIESQYFSIR